jgi:hypothetical protein
MTGEMQMVRQCVYGQLADSVRIGCFIMGAQNQQWGFGRCQMMKGVVQ